jgi:hypothetical protein
MHLAHCASKTLSEGLNKDVTKDLTIESYRATLPTFLAHENVLKMILSKQDMPSE